MKKILILGATSEIGKALSIIFGKGNHLILVGRNKEKLELLNKQCKKNNAKKIDLLCHDFSKEKGLIQIDLFSNIDIVINLVSSSSRVMDSKILFEDFTNYLVTDLSNIFRMITDYIIPNSKKIKIIQISSIIEQIKTPDRQLYGSIKTIFKLFLETLAKNKSNIEILIVNIGTMIDHKNETTKTNKVAMKIFEGHNLGCTKLDIGLYGSMLKIIFNLNPMLANSLIGFKRIFKN
jgi:short-subunit dehydrogenase